MRNAFGKSYAKAARVGYGDVLISVRVKKDGIKNGIEALRRG